MADWNTRVNEIFLSALEKATVRQAYLDTACGSDLELRRAVEAMLTAHEKAGSSLDDPVAPADTAMQTAPLPGAFGRYRIKGVLGQGGMARVYVAFDTLLEREVALKVPHASELADPTAVKRFYREARVAAGFTDPHLCPVYDVGEIGGVHYLTMPLLRGETLSARLQRNGPMAPVAAARIALAIAGAMQVAHQAGVLHRDLKPSNIILDEAGAPTVMDFGLARRTNLQADRVTGSGITAGTPAYLAPEQIGGGEELTPATDIYSLGIVLFEMLTGRLPVEGTTTEILRQRLIADPQPPSRHCRALDPRLDAICLTAMAREPERRFVSMQAFAAALAQVLGEGPTETALDPRFSAAPRPDRRPKPAVFVALLVAAALCGAIWIAFVLKQRSGAAKESDSDPLPVGSKWTGQFRFFPFGTKDGDLNVQITARDGHRFEGNYAAEKGQHEWRIAGMLQGSKIHWEFTSAVRGDGAAGLVGQGSVDGTVNGNTIDAEFHDASDNSHAKINLTRE